MYPLTLQAAIMRHMLNLARQLASGDLLESREKLEEWLRTSECPWDEEGVERC